MLLQHKDADAPNHANKWCLFGGGIERGESAHETIEREFMEELNWNIHDFKHFAKYKDNDVFVGRSRRHADVLKKQLHEGDNLGYFTEDEIMNMDIAKPHLEIIKDFLEKSKITVNFICRGNAFRSILAESYLKSLKLKGVRVISCGSVAAEHKKANEPNFARTVAFLAEHGLKEFTKPYHGNQLTQDLLDQTDIAVIMNDLVFKDTKETYTFPDKTYYWDVADIGEGNRILQDGEDRSKYKQEVFEEIKHNVDKLVSTRLKPNLL